jgi:hypothetical protein
MTVYKCITVAFAELAIMVLGIAALKCGVDGAIFVTTVAAISGLGGYSIKKITDSTNGKT